MTSINELKNRVNTKTTNFVLLSIATGGIYPIIWLHDKYKIIDEVTSTKTADNNYIIWLAVCLGLGNIFMYDENTSLALIGLLLTIALGVLYILWSFKAKDAIEKYALHEHKIDLQMNKFYTFFLTLYYINYCINEMPEVLAKKQILDSN